MYVEIITGGIVIKRRIRYMLRKKWQVRVMVERGSRVVPRFLAERSGERVIERDEIEVRGEEEAQGI